MPAIHKILDVQGFSYVERDYIFCLLGRMLRKVNAEDSWGVFLYFLGIAGTGKSSLLRLLAALFETRDVGYLNNALQKTFALDGVENKHIYLALDIDDKFQLDQATWNSMVVGEEVAVNRKFKQPFIKPWTSHGSAAGNRLMPYVDNSGSLARRLIVVEFLSFVKNVDTNLFQDCLDQLPRFLYVINSSYRHYVEMLGGNRSIKEVMPEKFKISERKALMELNVLLAIISTLCILDEAPRGQRTRFCGWKEFQELYKDYCRAQNVPFRPLVYSFYSGVFSKYGLEKIDPKSAADDPFKQSASYLLGLSIKPQAS
jgi:energy-coupling factor transporter ATP-binding protein EcfA2